MMRIPIQILCGLALALAPVVAFADDPSLTELEAKHLSNLRQVTFGLPRAGEGYFSPDGQLICYQAYPVGYPFYQIYIQRLDEREAHRISPGRGRTTCSFFSRDGKKLIFASSHSDPNMAETERLGREEAARGGHRRYQWNFDPHMEIYESNLDGSGIKAAHAFAAVTTPKAASQQTASTSSSPRRATETRTCTSWTPTARTCGSSRISPATTAARSSRPTTSGSSSAATARRRTCCSSTRSRPTESTKSS